MKNKVPKKEGNCIKIGVTCLQLSSFPVKTLRPVSCIFTLGEKTSKVGNYSKCTIYTPGTVC